MRDHEKVEFARFLRKNDTKAEGKVWWWLRNRRMLNLKFRRQYPCGKYILDFYCPDEKICIEIDGSHHGDEAQYEYDQERTKYLNIHGIKVIRLWNRQILNKSSATYDWLEQTIAKFIHPH